MTNQQEDIFPADDENSESKPTKGGVAYWEYKNSDEDFERLIVISLENLQAQVDRGDLEPGDIAKIVYGMEGAITVLKDCFNIYPKTPEFENKKPNDFGVLDDEKNIKE
jgi:hypothetical protein